MGLSFVSDAAARRAFSGTAAFAQASGVAAYTATTAGRISSTIAST
jgi:hypothetical protein